MKKAIAALMITLGFAGSANAWGEREQAALIGVATAILATQALGGQVTVAPVIAPVIAQPRVADPVYVQQPYYYDRPQYNHYQRPYRYRGSEKVCRQLPVFHHGRYVGDRWDCYYQ